MYSVYRLRVDELDERFLQALKTLFVDKVIEITVSEIGGVANGATNGVKHEMDETAYLFQSPANRKHLLEAVEYINSGQPLAEVNLADFNDNAQTTAPDDNQ